MPPLPPAPNAVVASPADGSPLSSLSSASNLKDVLMRFYSTEHLCPKPTGFRKDSISRIVKTQIVPKLKFIPMSSSKDEKKFGSFWRPDLVENTPKFVDVILDNFPEFRHRTQDESTLVTAAKFWVSSAPLIKQVLLDRRSNVTQRIKKDILVGKKLNFESVLCIKKTNIFIFCL